MKKIVVLLPVLFVLLVASFASAVMVSIPSSGEKTSDSGSFKVEYDTIKGVVYPGQRAEFSLKVTANINKTLNFDLDFTNTGEWMPIKTDPVYHSLTGMKVSLGNPETTTVIIKPRDTTSVGSYVVESVIKREDTGEEVTILLPLSVGSSSEFKGEYLPSIKATVQISNRVDPREENKVLIILKNNNFRNITNITIHIESVLLGKKIIQDVLGPNEAKTIKVPLMLDEDQQPIEDTIYTYVYADNTLFTPAQKTITIIDYTEELTKNIIEKSSFLKNTKIITLTNEVNFRKGEQLKFEKSFIERLFTFSSKDSQLFEKDGKKYVSWYIELGPGESFQLKTSTNYRPLFYVLLFIAICVILHYLFKSPITVTKKYTNVHMKEGGISEIKILLNVKNNGKERIKDLDVIDRVPHIAEVKHEFPVGTLRPYKILKHRRKGTIVKWRLSDLDAHEERIINYEVKSKLPIIGDMTLLPTVAKYKTPKGREVIVRSKSLLVQKS